MSKSIEQLAPTAIDYELARLKTNNTEAEAEAAEREVELLVRVFKIAALELDTLLTAHLIPADLKAEIKRMIELYLAPSRF